MRRHRKKSKSKLQSFWIGKPVLINLNKNSNFKVNAIITVIMFFQEISLRKCEAPQLPLPQFLQLKSFCTDFENYLETIPSKINLR